MTDTVSDKYIPVTDAVVNNFIKEVNLRNGKTVGKILDEVGPCGWGPLWDNATNLTTQAPGAPQTAALSGEATLQSAAPDNPGDVKVNLWVGLRGTAVNMAYSELPAIKCPDDHKLEKHKKD